MKNYNYNLVKLLHNALDNVWRIEKHYRKDANDLDCQCKEILEKIREDNQKHAEMLIAEMEAHSSKQDFK